MRQNEQNLASDSMWGTKKKKVTNGMLRCWAQVSDPQVRNREEQKIRFGKERHGFSFSHSKFKVPVGFPGRKLTASVGS